MLVAPGTTLLDALRENQGLTGTRRGCDQGACGTCTVLVDGKPMLSCLMPVETIEGARVETDRGPDAGGGAAPDAGGLPRRLRHPVRLLHAGHDHGDGGAARRQSRPDPRRRGAGHLRQLCRCTGYEAIIDAVLDAAGRVRDARRSPSGLKGGVMEKIDPTFFANERPPTSRSSAPACQRADARGHVTGRTQFHEDVTFPNTLHLVMVRSTQHHALITLDVAPALAVPGVVRVLTHEDVPQNWYTILKLIGVGPTTSRCCPKTACSSWASRSARCWPRPAPPRSKARGGSSSTTTSCRRSSTSRRP